MFRRFLAASAMAAVVGVSACTPSYFDTTSDPYTPGDGGWADAGDLNLRNIVAVSDQEGSATLVGTILNRGDRADRLVSVTVPGGEATLEPVAVPRSGRLQMGATGPGGEGTVQHIELRGESLQPGRVLDLTFDFQHSASAELEVAVVEREGWYEEVPLPGELLEPGNPPEDGTIP